MTDERRARFKTWKAWTGGDERQLELLRCQGLSCRTIAERMGRTEAAIKCKLAEFFAPKASASRERWLAELLQPHTIAGVAARLGVTKWAVKRAKNRLRRAGIDVPAANRGHQTSVEQWSARETHNLEVAGSNPAGGIA